MMKKKRFDIRIGIDFNSPLGEYLQEFAAEGNHSDRLKQLAIMGMALMRIKGLNFARAFPLEESSGKRQISAGTHLGTNSHFKNGTNGGAGAERVKQTAPASATDLDYEMPLDFDPSILKIRMRPD